MELYFRLPDTPRRLSSFDLHLVRQLWQPQVSVTLIETPFLLASARRAARPVYTLPLRPIHSLH